MLTSVFLLALTVFDTAAASVQQCTPKQLGKYAPISSDRAAQKYCAAYLHGKVPRSVGERAGQTPIECLRSDLKKEKKSYQSAICSCFVSPTTSTTKSTTKCTTKTTTSTKKASTRTSRSTTTSTVPAPSCTPNKLTDTTFCRYSQNCDQALIGEYVQAPSQQPDERRCLAICDAMNGGPDENGSANIFCRGYNYKPSTRKCEVFSSISDVIPAPGVNSAQILYCACDINDPKACEQQR